MKSRELVMLHVKARINSWLSSGPVPVVVGTTGGPVAVAFYNNGKYVQPESVTIPDGVPEGWGPDGPIQLGTPEETPEDEEEGSDE